MYHDQFKRLKFAETDSILSTPGNYHLHYILTGFNLLGNITFTMNLQAFMIRLLRGAGLKFNPSGIEFQLVQCRLTLTHNQTENI